MLTSESLKFINYLKNHISEIKDIRGFKELFNLLQNHKYNYENPVINTMTKSFIDYKPRFISGNLYKQFKEHNKCKEIVWDIKSDYIINCKLNIFYKKFISTEIMNCLVGAISFIMSFSQRNLDLTLNVLLLKDKKIFNNKFTSNEINSGMADYSNNIIHIWRKEEIVKVLIHECIHILKFSALKDNNTIINHYNNRYDIKCSYMNINESYTEIWAKLLNCYYVSSMINLNKNEKFNLFLYFIQIEKDFSLIQSYKIREYIKKNKKVNINKNTNVVAYYLILSEILQDLNKFIILFDFYLINNNNFIDYLLNLPYSQKDYKNLNKNLINTFRMTAVELNV